MPPRLDASVEAIDNPLGAYAIASASTLPAFRSSPSQTLHLLTEANIKGLSVDDASPTTRAWIHSLEAEAHARGGDEGAALQALDAAELVLAELGDEEEPRPRVPFFDDARLLGERGVTLVRLDMPHESMDYLDEAMRLTESDQKIQSMLLTSLALAHVRRGEIDQACAMALRSLESPGEQTPLTVSGTSRRSPQTSINGATLSPCGISISPSRPSFEEDFRAVADRVPSSSIRGQLCWW